MYKKIFFDFFAVLFPKTSVKILYKKRTKKTLNLEKPITFDDKIQWLKLYYQDPLIVQCADKYNVRSYVTEKNLSSILTDLYGVYENPDEIDFDRLPDKFAVKVTSGCRMNIIVKEKTEFNWNRSKKQLTKWLKEDFGKVSVEPHYSYIKGKLIVEEYLSDKNGIFPTDYKFFCFNGVPRFVELITERTDDNQYNRHFYDLDWNKMSVTKEENDSELNPPENLQEMIRIAKILSEDFPFVRVDLYDIDGKVVFGELTFTPNAGMATYLTDEAQREFGDMLELPKEKKIGFKE